jgi:hypothetical protein
MRLFTLLHLVGAPSRLESTVLAEVGQRLEEIPTGPRYVGSRRWEFDLTAATGRVIPARLPAASLFSAFVIPLPTSPNA